MDMDKQHEGRNNRADQHNRGDQVQDDREDKNSQINEVFDLTNAENVNPRLLDADVLPGFVDHLQQVVKNLELCLQKKDEQAAEADLFTDHVMEQNRMMSLCLAKTHKSMMDYAMQIEKECSAYQVSCSGSKKSCDKLQNLVVTLVEEVNTWNKLSELRKQAYLQVVSKLCNRSEIFVEILEVVDKIKECRGKWEKGKRSFVMYFRKALERLGRESLTEELCGFLDDVMLKAEECMYSNDLHSGLSRRVKNASRYCEKVDTEVWDKVEDRMRCENTAKPEIRDLDFEDRSQFACDTPGLLVDLLDLIKLRKVLLDVELAKFEGAGDNKALSEDCGQVSYFTEDGCRVAFSALDEALTECCALASQNVGDSIKIASNKDDEIEDKAHARYVVSQGGEYEEQITSGSSEDSQQERLSVDSLEINEVTVCTGLVHESKDEDAQDNGPEIGQTASQGSYADTAQGRQRVKVAEKSSSRTTLDVESLQVKSDKIGNTSNGSVLHDRRPPVYTQKPDNTENPSKRKENLLLPNDCECYPHKAEGKLISQAIVTTFKDIIQFGESMLSCKSLPKFACPPSSLSLASNDSLFVSCFNTPQTGGLGTFYLRGTSLDNSPAIGSSRNNKMTMSEQGRPRSSEIGRSKSYEITIRRSRSPIENHVSGEDSLSIRKVSTVAVPLKRGEGKMGHLCQSADSLDSFPGIYEKKPVGISTVSFSRCLTPSNSSEMGEDRACNEANSKELWSDESVDFKPSADWSKVAREVRSVPICLTESSSIEHKCSSSDGESMATPSHSVENELNQTFIVSGTRSSIELPVVFSSDSPDSAARRGQIENSATSGSLVKDSPHLEPDQNDVQCETFTYQKQQNQVQSLPEFTKGPITGGCEMVSPTDSSNDFVKTSTPDGKKASGEVHDGDIVSCHSEDSSVGCLALDGDVASCHSEAVAVGCLPLVNDRSIDVVPLSGRPKQEKSLALLRPKQEKSLTLPRPKQKKSLALLRPKQKKSLALLRPKQEKSLALIRPKQEKSLALPRPKQEKSLALLRPKQEKSLALLTADEKKSNEDALNGYRAPENSPDLEITDATFTIETTTGGKRRKRAKHKKQNCKPSKKKAKENENCELAENLVPEVVLKGVKKMKKKKMGKTLEAHRQKNQSPGTPVYRLRERNLDRRYRTRSPSAIKEETLSESEGHEDGAAFASASPKQVSTLRNTRRANKRFLEVKGSSQVLPELYRTPRKMVSNSRPPVKNILAERHGYSTESKASSASHAECIEPSATKGDCLLMEKRQQKAGKDMVEKPKKGKVRPSHVADVRRHANQEVISQGKCLHPMLEIVVGVKLLDKKTDIIHKMETSNSATKRGGRFGSKYKLKPKPNTVTMKIIGETGNVTGEGVYIRAANNVKEEAGAQNSKTNRINGSNIQKEKATDNKVDLAGKLDNSEGDIEDSATTEPRPVEQNLGGETRSREGDVEFCREDDEHCLIDHQNGTLDHVDEVNWNLTKVEISQKTNNGEKPTDVGLIWSKLDEDVYIRESESNRLVGKDKDVMKVPADKMQQVVGKKNEEHCKTGKGGPSDEGGLKSVMLTCKSSRRVEDEAEQSRRPNPQVRYSLRGEDVLSVLPIPAGLAKEASPSKRTACKDRVLTRSSKSSKYHLSKTSNNMKKKELLEAIRSAPNCQNGEQADVAKVETSGNTCEHVQTSCKDEDSAGGRTCLPSVRVKGNSDSAVEGHVNENLKWELKKSKDKGIFIVSELKPVSKFKSTCSFDDAEHTKLTTRQCTPFTFNSKGQKYPTSSVRLISRLSLCGNAVPGHVDAVMASGMSGRISARKKLHLAKGSRSLRSDIQLREDTFSLPKLNPTGLRCFIEGATARTNTSVGLSLPKQVHYSNCPQRRISFPQILDSKTNSVKTPQRVSPRFCHQKPARPRLPNIASPITR